MWGGIIDRHAAWVLLRGRKTMTLRMDRHNSNGLALARFLESHPKVRQVWYPGLESHPDHEIAMRSRNSGHCWIASTSAQVARNRRGRSEKRFRS